jgi:3-deoxy-D-manno-octulosonic-acid transferase
MPLYGLLVTLLSPFVALWIAIKPRGRIRLSERFGLWKPLSLGETYCWFHAASVGEVKGLRPVITEYRQAYPAEKILLTVTSTTALQEASSIADDVRLLPFDAPCFYALAVKKAKVSKVIITETELWPGLISFLAWRRIPLAWVNARMAEATVQRYRRIRWMFGRLLQNLACVIAIDAVNAERFGAVGIPKERITVIPNSKYDRAPYALDVLRQKIAVTQKKERVVTIGNLRSQEALHVLTAVIPFAQDMLLFVVPRHPESFTVIQQMLSELLSEREQSDLLIDSATYRVSPCLTGIVFVNEFGVLEALYAQSGMAISAGSFHEAYQGHNLLEAAPYKVFLVTGMYNQSSKEIACELVEDDAIVVLNDPASLQDVIAQFLREPSYVATVVQRYYDFAAKFLGAGKCIVERLKEVVPS